MREGRVFEASAQSFHDMGNARWISLFAERFPRESVAAKEHVAEQIKELGWEPDGENEEELQMGPFTVVASPPDFLFAALEYTLPVLMAQLDALARQHPLFISVLITRDDTRPQEFTFEVSTEELDSGNAIVFRRQGEALSPGTSSYRVSSRELAAWLVPFGKREEDLHLQISAHDLRQDLLDRGYSDGVAPGQISRVLLGVQERAGYRPVPKVAVEFKDPHGSRHSRFVPKQVVKIAI